MTPVFGRIAPGRLNRLNLAMDLLFVGWAMTTSMLVSGGGITDGALHLRIAVGSFVWLLSAAALHHYDPWAHDRDATDEAMMVTVLCAAVGTTLFLLNKFVAGAPLPRTLETTGLLWAPAVALRVFVFRPLAREDGAIDSVLIVGTGPLGRMTGEELERSKRRRVLGYLSFPDEQHPSGLGFRYLGDFTELQRLLASMSVDEVFIAGNALRRGQEMQEIIHVCERQGVPFALPATSFGFERATPIALRGVRNGYLHYHPFNVRPHEMAFKRLFDIATTAVALWLLLPVMVAIAVAIKVTSRGPILFRQRRTGLHGKPFNMLKFRSMVVNAEQLKASLAAQNEQAGPVFKIRNDPRVTRVGRFIRKYSLDELPQLINVLRGDMSVVGPRPPLETEVARYEPWQRRRLCMRPGLTCIWQVSGRNQISFEEWMHLDMKYIDSWSFGLDMNLIFRTVPVVLTGRGAS